jgi:PTH1 family peptidyl-tRNA hydrolase
MCTINLVLGLGNPGEDYKNTRHNLGFEVLNLLASRYNLEWTASGSKADRAAWKYAGRDVILLKPRTYMNLSGKALPESESIPAGSILVLCDDINLPLGIIRIRRQGGTGGHRGLESLSERLESEDYARLRMGVGPVPPDRPWSDFVLDRFTENEEETAREMIRTAAEAVKTILIDGVEAGQQRFNRKL